MKIQQYKYREFSERFTDFKNTEILDLYSSNYVNDVYDILQPGVFMIHINYFLQWRLK